MGAKEKGGNKVSTQAAPIEMHRRHIGVSVLVHTWNIGTMRGSYYRRSQKRFLDRFSVVFSDHHIC